VTPYYLRSLFWSRPLSPEAAAYAERRIGEYDVDQVLLDSAVKSTDGFFTTFFVSPYSKYIARWAARRGLTPNQVTTVSMLLGALAAAGFATGERWGLVAGAILLQVSFTTDCVDGQLARYTRQFSTLGAWLDSVFDRGKEYLAFAGLAIGAAHTGDPVWVLACAAITLQTVRHTSDFSYMAVAHQSIAVTPQTPIEEPLDHAGVQAAARRAARAAGAAPPPAKKPLATRILVAWQRLDRSGALRWVKRMAAFPIGERFAVISITAAFFSATVTFIALLSWGGLAIVYTQTGRVLRSIR
jgi:phosphatidylglycerophosphate synthase